MCIVLELVVDWFGVIFVYFFYVVGVVVCVLFFVVYDFLWFVGLGLLLF